MGLDSAPVYAGAGRVAIRVTSVDVEVYARDGGVYRRVFWGARGRLGVLDLARLAFLVGAPATPRGRRP